MRGKDVSALSVGLHVLGGIIAGMLIGYIVDNIFEYYVGIKTSPWGVLVFFFVGIISGFLNAYREMKRVLK